MKKFLEFITLCLVSFSLFSEEECHCYDPCHNCSTCYDTLFNSFSKSQSVDYSIRWKESWANSFLDTYYWIQHDNNDYHWICENAIIGKECIPSIALCYFKNTVYEICHRAKIIHVPDDLTNLKLAFEHYLDPEYWYSLHEWRDYEIPQLFTEAYYEERSQSEYEEEIKYYCEYKDRLNKFREVALFLTNQILQSTLRSIKENKQKLSKSTEESEKKAYQFYIDYGERKAAQYSCILEQTPGDLDCLEQEIA